MPKEIRPIGKDILTEKVSHGMEEVNNGGIVTLKKFEHEKDDVTKVKVVELGSAKSYEVKVGDICFTKYNSGVEVRKNGKTYLMYKPEEILAVETEE